MTRAALASPAAGVVARPPLPGGRAPGAHCEHIVMRGGAVRYVFGECVLDTDRFELRRDGMVVPLEPQVFDVLALLIRERHRVVTKNQLLDTVWGDRFVSDSALTSRVKAARQAVRDTGRDQNLIRTVHGRGYQFVGDVTENVTMQTPPSVHSRHPPDVISAPEVDLLERDADLAVLADLRERASRGRGSLVLVRGEPGAGKTALARRSCADAIRSGVRVLWGTCTPLSTPAPLEPLNEAVQPIGGVVAALVVDDAPVHRILAALLDELTHTPTVLVVDDLHWADQATIDLMRLLSRRVQRTRSLLIGIHRDEEVGPDHPLRPLIGDVVRSDAASQLMVGPLSKDAVATIVAGLGRDLDEVLQLTGGNAFFVREVATAPGESLPATVRDAVLARTADLTPAAHDVLALVTCAPEAVPDVVLPALGVDLPTLRSLQRTGLLERGPRGLRFRHELCRLAVADLIPAGGEVALHARVLEALERDGRADPAVLTHHARGAHDSARVARYAALAGRRAAATGAHAQAVDFFQLALDQPERLDADEQAELLERLAQELYFVDRLTDAVVAGDRARTIRAAEGDTAGAGSVCHALSLYEYYNADRGRADRHAAEAIELLEPTGDPIELGHAYATEAYLAIQRNDVAGTDDMLTRIRRLAEPAADLRLRMRVDMLQATRDVLVDREGAREQLLAVAAAGLRAELYYPASTSYSLLVYFDVEQRRLRAARELLDISLPLAVDRDIRICEVWQLGARARLNLLGGDWDAALLDAGVMLGADSVPLGRPWAELVAGLIGLRRGNEDSRAHLDAAWERARRLDEPLRVLPAAAAIAEQAWLTGRPDGRVDEAVAVLRATAGVPGLEWSRGDLATWLRRLGCDLPRRLAVAKPYQLMLNGQGKDAAVEWARIGEPYEQALTLLDSGGADAIEALRLLDSLDAAVVAAKLRQRLRDEGVTTIPAGPRAVTRTNPAGLTARELEVLTLLAEGWSNSQLAARLYVSPKTVGHHVSAILAKLHADTRTEAVHRARQSGILA